MNRINFVRADAESTSNPKMGNAKVLLARKKFRNHVAFSDLLGTDYEPDV
jgi:hypothetical protein